MLDMLFRLFVNNEHNTYQWSLKIEVNVIECKYAFSTRQMFEGKDSIFSTSDGLDVDPLAVLGFENDAKDEADEMWKPPQF